MYRYKSHCRFNLLIALKNKILEIRPGEIVEIDFLIDHPNLVLMDQPKQGK